MMTKTAIAVAFSEGKFEQCFDSLTEATIWDTPGEQYLTGKDAIEEFCKKTAGYFDSVTTVFKPLNLIASDNKVAINGTAEFLRDRKRIAFVHSCDVYEFDTNNKIISIHSYCITERPEVNT